MDTFESLEGTGSKNSARAAPGSNRQGYRIGGTAPGLDRIESSLHEQKGVTNGHPDVASGRKMTCSALGAGCAADIWSCGAYGAILAASEIGRILSVLSGVVYQKELLWPALGRVLNKPLRY